MRKRTVFFATAIALFLWTRPAAAGLNRWTTHTPLGATITALASDPSGTVVYAATRGNGIYKSTDSGEHWESASGNVPSQGFTAIAVAPDDPNTVYAGTLDGAFLKTTDGGSTWKQSSAFPVALVSIAIDRGRGLLFATAPTLGSMVFSADDGKTWQATTVQSYGYRFAVVNGRDYAINYIGIFVSDDGRTWKPVFSLQDARLSAIVGTRTSVFAAGSGVAYVSNDNGQTWTPVASPLLPAVHGLAAIPNGHIFAATTKGVFEFDGTEWRQFGDPLSSRDVGAVAPVDSGATLIAGTTTGLFKSDTATAGWRAVGHAIGRISANDVSVAALQPDTIFSATPSGILKSVDRGETWATAFDTATEHVAVALASPDSVYAVTATDILKSADGGSHWDGIKSSTLTSGLGVSADSRTVYAALADGMYKTSDGGSSWVKTSSGFDMYYAFYNDFTTPAIVVDPTNSATAYASDWAGVYKTVDGGATWALKTTRTVNAIAVDPRNPSTVYGGTILTHGLIVSTDGFATFSLDQSLDATVVSLAVNPVDSTLYAGTSAGDVFRRTSDGWAKFDDGLIRSSVTGLTISASGKTLYAATAGGVFEYDISAATFDATGGGSASIAQLLDQSMASGNAFLIPITGSGTGAFNTRFATDLIVANGAGHAQNLVVAWLPANGSAAAYQVTVPEASNGSFVADTINERLGVTGLGALFVAAVDSSGASDRSASINGSARIWTSSDLTDETSQVVPSVPAGSLAAHSTSITRGLREDAAFRTNFGIVNLDSSARDFRVHVGGDRKSQDLVITVPALSVVHASVPAGDYGALNITASTTTPSHWALYGTAIDNATGAATTVIGDAQ